jgi:hypothetical protein
MKADKKKPILFETEPAFKINLFFIKTSSQGQLMAGHLHQTLHKRL